MAYVAPLLSLELSLCRMVGYKMTIKKEVAMFA
jgi:hypothetical protein